MKLLLLSLVVSRVCAFVNPALPAAIAPTAHSLTSALEAKKENYDDFRASLTKQVKRQEKFDGYDLNDIIVDKWGVPYFIDVKKSVFLGKPTLSMNVMWRFLGQESFPLSEQEYLEHLQALAELLVKWDRVAHFKQVVSESKKRPNAYFGYAVPLPLNLPPDTLTPYFKDHFQ